MRALYAAATLGICAFTLPANADIIVSLVGNPVAVAGGFDYTYNATLSVDEQLDPSVQPVFFTLYDFGAATFVGDTGFLATKSGTTAEWTYTLDKNQTTYAQATTPNNSSGIADVRVTYSGPQELPTSLTGGVGNLGTFTLFTTYTGAYHVFNNNQDAQLEKYAPSSGTNDSDSSNINSVAVPTLGRAIPEPSTVAMFGVGLLGLAAIRRRGARPASARSTTA